MMDQRTTIRSDNVQTEGPEGGLPPGGGNEATNVNAINNHFKPIIIP